MSTTFADLGVPAEIHRALAARGITEAFPIQTATIPDGLAGRDLCGKAPTGSGKTIAFGIPMVARVQRAAPKRPKGLVLAPTRELALQVADELRALGDLRVLAVYGGAGIEPQLKKLRAGVDIVVACPGRLLDVIDRKACSLRDVSFVVIDEADRMADMGFLPDVRRILDQTSEQRQTLLFSATLDGAVDSLVKQYQTDPSVHEMEEEEGGDVTHHLWRVERPERVAITAQIVAHAGPTVVFSRTRHGADRIARQLGKLGVSAAAIHGNRSQGQRERALGEFHRGEVKALVATDVAARGIHVEGVTCVVHFDIPADHKDYVHRSGRTGRAGRSGSVVALVGAAQRSDAHKLARAADIDATVSDPDVALLPAGHLAFTDAARRKAAASPKRNRTKGGPAGRAGRDDRFRTDAPEGGRERRPHPGRPGPDGKAERAGRPPRRDETGRPGAKAKSTHARNGTRSTVTEGAAGDRPARARGPERDRREGERGQRQQTKRNGGNGDRATAPSRGQAHRSPGSPDLDRALSGSPKVRPSGASRRKARREALIAAGIDPAEAGAKRSSARRGR